MPISVPCPSCKRLLRAPESVLGQLVQCPSCSTTFTAQEPPAPRGGEDRSRPTSERGGQGPLSWGDGSGSRSDVAARDAVVGPANLLMVVGILSILLSLLALVGGVAEDRLETIPRDFDPGDAQDLVAVSRGACGAGVGLVLAIVVTAGAVRMKGLQNYRLAVTACVLAMLPCHYCCMLGLPLGLWALIVLCRSDVRQAFG